MWPSSALDKGHNIGTPPRGGARGLKGGPGMKTGSYGLYILGDPCATNLLGKAAGLNGS